VSEPPGDEQWDDVPEEIVIDSFADISEVTAKIGPRGAEFQLRGPGGPARLVFLVVPTAFAFAGFAAAVTVILASKPIWQAGLVLATGVVLAYVSWRVLGRQARSD